MNRRRLIVALVVGVACYAALLLLAGRLNPARVWEQRLDRPTAIERARAVALALGVDASAWQPFVHTTTSDLSYFYRMTKPRERAPDDARLTPARVVVLLVDPKDGKRFFRASFTTDARLKSFEHSTPGGGAVKTDGDGDAVRSGTNDRPPIDPVSKLGETSSVVDSATIETAAAALTRIVGAGFADYRLVSQKVEKIGDAEGARLTWERVYEGTPEFKGEASALVFDGAVREANVAPDFAQPFEREYDARQRFINNVEGGGAFLLVFVMLAVPLLYFFIRLNRRVRHAEALALFTTIFLCGLISALLSIFDAKMVGELSDSNTRPEVLFESIAQATLLPLFYALGAALVWVVGFTFARRHLPLRFAPLVALLRGKLTTRFVGESLLCGILLGGVFAVVPYIAWIVLPGLMLSRPDPELFVVSAPVLAAVIQPFGFGVFALYAFVLPISYNYPRLARVTRFVVPFLAVLYFVESVSKTSSAFSGLVVGCVLALFADFVFRRYDLLTLLVALSASGGAVAGTTLLASQIGATRLAGWGVFALLAAFAAAAALIASKGHAANVEDEIEVDPADALAGEMKAERERLVAEFGVAREAQQRMLPDRPPRIPGYDIAASCRPAREVGGDLYDFFKLPNERVGIVVADVSGKGVPAALYMTLTKGLLASVADLDSDPQSILREVNRHLYEVCRRKMFVTLILGVLDPATRTLHLARAGHNPTVWRRARADEVKSLRAPGLGLGLNKGTIFDRALKTETIVLEEGDAVFFYSDGVTEAMNAEREEYGDERLQEIVRQTDGLDAAATERAVLTDVYEFLGELAPQDDVTLVVLRVGDFMTRPAGEKNSE